MTYDWDVYFTSWVSSVNHWYRSTPEPSARTLTVTWWFLGTHTLTGWRIIAISDGTSRYISHRRSLTVHSHRRCRCRAKHTSDHYSTVEGSVSNASSFSSSSSSRPDVSCTTTGGKSGYVVLEDPRNQRRRQRTLPREYPPSASSSSCQSVFLWAS